MENQRDAHVRRHEEAKALASRLMHMHYCDGDAGGVASFFAPQFTWLGAGEEQYLADRGAAAEMFRRFGGAIPRCDIRDEEYDVIEPAPGVYVVTGRMWITTAPGVEMYLKVHQRVTFVFQETPDGLRCAHIHCSNPYQEMVEEELFPEKIGRQSYDFVQERLAALEAQTVQQNRQLEVVMSSIAGGMKISRDDETYSFAFVSREAAALFGYTVEEFMEASGGSAVGAVYPPDLAHALADCAEAFRDGGLSYSTRYRVRCKDGSLKWIIDSGKKARDAEGNWMVNSLYLDVTQAEEDSQRLREQTALLTSIYDTVPCGIIRFVRRKGGACDLISLNRAALSLLGYESMEEGLRDWHGGVLGTVLEEDRVMLRKTYLLLHEVGDRQDREYRARWRDGSVHWLEGTNMIVGRTEEGDAVIQRTVVDITPRRALQQQLEQEQEMYRVAMESSSDTLFEYLVDSDTFISYEPQHGQGIIRREIRDYSRRLRDETFIHPEDVPAALDNICNGRGEMFEMRVVTPGAAPGDYRWHRVSSRPILREGRLSRVVGTIRDIHSMKETLSENSERLHMSQSALQAISGMYVSIFYVNLTADEYYAVRLPQASDAMAFPRTGSFTGDLCERLLPHVAEGDRPRVARLCDRERLLGAFSSISGHTEAEFHRTASDGTASPWLRLEIHPVSMEGAETRTAIVTLRNISGEKRRELERQAEDQAAKRALEEAYEGARRANHAKSEFLSRMSHDIRTPMNAILGMTSIAEKQLGDPDKLADCLGKIRISGNHLLGLINEVLDMSKIESGSVSLSENTFLVSDTLNTVMQIIRSDAESKEQQIVLRSYLRHDAVHGDFMRVQQILLNLLSNAVKYTGTGGHISLTAEERVSGRSGVGCFEFTVEDDGIGMPPEFLDKLFTPFERAKDARVSGVQGTGLGLAITHNLVQMMNGTIRVESQPDKGTRFVVTIFLKLAGEDAREAGSCAGSPARQGEAFPPGTRLLLVEDNDLNREIARELLGMAGLEIACAENGRQAVDLFASHPPGAYALILMDIQMPVMDGYEATKAIRRLAGEGRPDAADIPIIALTANAFADDVYRARQAGMNEHVTKPLEIDRLLETLHRWIG
ncbi:ATP-binding protein [Anaerotruncus massiliensis (ex Liu et al. 2021)]|uniref:ATP-binding protein n=1 Tax=Anaerotruncus massiliensis (ex Liu et al. 2021) TaxID=2321404 RepID=UPI003AF6551C